MSVLLGSNRDEWASWDIASTPHNLTEAGFDALINVSGWNATQISALKQLYAFGGKCVADALPLFCVLRRNMHT